jgi:hypothetical protein
MKFSRKSLAKFLLSSTAALLATAMFGSAAMADTFFVSASAAVGSFNSGTGTFTGGGDGSAGNPFGSIEEAYRAAYVDTSGNPVTIQLDPGTYSGAHLGTFNGQVGVVNLGGDNYYNANGGAPGDATPSITIEGSNAASILGSGYSPSPGALAAGMFRAQNSYQTGLTIKDVNINTTGSPELFGSMTTQGFKVSLINDTIKLGTPASPSYFYYENGQIPAPGVGGPLTGGGFTFTNSTIQLGLSSPNVLGEVWQNFNGGVGPNGDIFDGTNTSSIYDANDNLITDLSSLYLADRNGVPNPGNGQYPLYYQNGFNFSDTGPSPAFAQNFLTEAAAPVATPEPSSIVALCGVAAMGLCFAARRRRARIAR